jgi:hypothetical protein
LFNEGDPFDLIYLIKKGEVLLVKKKKKSDKGLSKLLKGGKGDLHKHLLEEGTPMTNTLDRNPDKKNMLWDNKLKKIGTIGVFSFIGETDLLDGRTTRACSAVANAGDTEVYCINQHDFKTSESFMKEFFADLRDLARNKSNFRFLQYKNVMDVKFMCGELEEKLAMENDDYGPPAEEIQDNKKTGKGQPGKKGNAGQCPDMSEIHRATNYHPDLYKELCDQQKELAKNMMKGPVNDDIGQKGEELDRNRRAKI